MARLQLTQDARHTAGWQQTKTFLEAELIELREQNDSDLDELKTAGIRAQIALIKKMLLVEKQKPEYRPMAAHED